MAQLPFELRRRSAVRLHLRLNDSAESPFRSVVHELVSELPDEVRVLVGRTSLVERESLECSEDDLRLLERGLLVDLGPELHEHMLLVDRQALAGAPGELIYQCFDERK